MVCRKRRNFTLLLQNGLPFLLQFLLILIIMKSFSNYLPSVSGSSTNLSNSKNKRLAHLNGMGNFKE